MAQYGYSQTKPQVLKRLSKIEGQIRGISRMVAEDKYCIDVLTQITAAQAALDKAALELVREHTKYCMAHESHADEKADELVNALGRMLSR